MYAQTSFRSNIEFRFLKRGQVQKECEMTLLGWVRLFIILSRVMHTHCQKERKKHSYRRRITQKDANIKRYHNDNKKMKRMYREISQKSVSERDRQTYQKK